jgi:hypothetical protein
MASPQAWRKGANRGKMSARFSTTVLMQAICMGSISLCMTLGVLIFVSDLIFLVSHVSLTIALDQRCVPALPTAADRSDDQVATHGYFRSQGIRRLFSVWFFKTAHVVNRYLL